MRCVVEALTYGGSQLPASLSTSSISLTKFGVDTLRKKLDSVAATFGSGLGYRDAMKTYPFFNQAGRLFAFEVEKVHAARRRIGSLLGGVGDVSNVKVSRAFLPADDVHVDFLYGGKPYVVWEPWGDSSRFWIGPRDTNDDCVDLQNLERAFRDYRPRMITRVLRDLETLKSFSFKRR